MVFNPLGSNLVLLWNLIATIISIIAVMLVVQINGAIQKSGKLSSDVTRKLVHIFAAPVFVVTWLLFADDITSRYFAAIVPTLFVLLFVGIGTGRVVNEAFVASMSRSGDPRELLKGTLFYAIIILIVTLVWFYIPDFNPAALILFGCLAGGDGLADVIGRKYGGARKFGLGGAEKTVAGSIGMLIGSLLFSYILVMIFGVEAGYDLGVLLIPVLLCSIVATIVEALSPKHVDNLTVPIAVVITIVVLGVFAPTFWPFTLWTI